MIRCALESNFRSAVAVLAALLLTGGAPAAAQVLYGTIVGTVTDASQASVPGAQVKVSNIGTGKVWEVVTTADGNYSVSSIPPGVYSVTITAGGFRAFTQRNVVVAANSTVRVNASLELGQVSETIEVSAGAVSLQTDTMDVRNEIAATELENVPVPVTRNYQSLLVTVPGMSPPQDAHSISANPSRSLMINANGTTAQSVAVRVDGATTWNSWLPHVAGYVPALEAIEQVNVQTSSYEAELGYAGGAAVNVQIKSGTNELHGSGFEYHNNQHLKARPYFLPPGREKDKRILNQFGGTLGGPIKKNRVFFFGSYEGTLDRQSSGRLANVPTNLMRTGNLSESTRPVFDPLTGKEDGSSRQAFPGNIIPASRISPIIRKIVDLTPAPNAGTPGQLGNNFYSNGSFIYDRHVLDTKLTAQATDRLNLSARVSWLDWHFDNPPLYGPLGGTGIESRGLYDGQGIGDTKTMTYSAVYTATPNVVIDGYFGYTLIDNGVENIRLDEKLGLDFLGIPGTNGPGRAYGGWPGFAVTGFDTYGRAQNNSPWKLRLPQAQYVASTAWMKGNHNLRFGWDALWIAMDGNEPWGHPGWFTFNREVTGTVGTPTNDFNAYGSFLLGLPNSTEKRVRLETGTVRTWAHSLYFRDKWQVTPKLTASLGLRWDYFGVPTRTGGRGLEIYSFDSNTLKLCGVGSLPQNCGFSMGKKYFAPRLGIAYRPTDSFVIRAGYGIAWDPVNIGRNPLQTYPILSTATFLAPNSYRYVSEIAQGIPAVSPPSLGDGTITVPGTVAMELADPHFRRSYIQSWNLMLEKDFGGGWIGEAGYVGNRQIRLQNRWNANYGFIGGGTQSLVLNRKFGRTATTNFYTHQGGFRSWYDSLQATLRKRFSGGYTLRLSYTWSKALGPRGNENGVDGYTNNTPDYWPLIAKVPRSFDRTHNFNAVFSAEVPFGKGKRWASGRTGAALLGGWQISGLLTMYTGGPFSVTASGASLNAPGNGQIADQIKPVVEIFGTRDRWFDTSAYRPVTEARFGNSGWDQLRGPGLVNLDLGVFRAFSLTERVGLQFRAEAFNLSNTPHFGNPQADVSGTRFGEITGIRNTGREGIDERLFRFGLRLSF
jgi:hypothetical protein